LNLIINKTTIFVDFFVLAVYNVKQRVHLPAEHLHEWGKTMEGRIYEFVDWLYQSYGRTGCLIVLLAMLALLGVAFYVLNKLPESKEIIVWSKCTFCKYKSVEKNVVVLVCPKHEKEPFFQLKKPVCSRSIPELYKVKSVDNSVVMKKKDLPENYTA